MRAVGRVLLVLLAGGLLLAGCAAPQDGRALAAPSVSAGLDPAGLVRGTDAGDDDRLAAATLRDLEQYWGTEYPRLASGARFVPPRGYYSVDSTDAAAAAPPCAGATTELEGNAYYCPRADVLAYDRAALVPVLRDDFGDTAVVVVLAHEYGHAVQERLGTTGAVGPGGVPGSSPFGSALVAPTIVLEAQADCYGAAFLRRVRDGALPDLRTGAAGVDGAMGALVTFRDPVGTGASDADAHGNAYDRVSSFQIGFETGPDSCARMTTADRQFTQRTFASAGEAESGGNLPLEELLSSLGPDLNRFYAGVVSSRARPWTAPAIADGAGCGAGSPASPVSQGPVSWCDDTRQVRVDAAAARVPVATIGDYATGLLVASRYGLAALGALGRPTTGPDAGRIALCLAGAYSASVGSAGGDFGLSPGDLDEAVTLLLRDADPARGADGATAETTAYARVADFRTGVDRGADACLGA